MKTKQILTLILAVLLPITALAADKGFDLQKADVHDRMFYHRAIDAVV